MKLFRPAVLTTSSFFAALFLTLCSFALSAQGESLGFSFSAGDASHGMHVTVVDEISTTPVTGAQVSLTGATAGDTQSAITDAQGSANVPWPTSSPATLSVQAPGYAGVAIVGVTAANASIQLKALNLTLGSVVASGTMGGFTGMNAEDSAAEDQVAQSPELFPNTLVGMSLSSMSFLGTIKFGFVMHSISAFDLLNFNVNSFVSPLNDTINVQGSHQIPSNLVLPKQSLLLGTIKINKPNYRLPVLKGKPLTLSGLQGSVQASDLASGNISIGIMNKITLNRADIDTPTTPTADYTEVIGAGFPLAQQYAVVTNAPPFSADVLVAAAADINGDGTSLVPTDAKLAAAAGSAPSGATALMAATGATRVRDMVFAAAMSDSGRRVSGIISAAAANVTFGDFLNVDLGADNQPLPTAISLSTVNQGLAAVVLSDDNGAFQYIYAMPGAAAATINPGGLLNGHTPKTYSQVQLQFSTAVDQNNFDGRSALQGLAKFTRVQTTITP